MMGILYEKRPLKRPRLGPPDVYPQEPRQKEDELTSLNVKHGFATMPQLTDEFGTARNCNVTAAKVGAYFNAILAKKEELATMPDTGRKRQQINPKDNFWPVTARTKNGIEAWFKDLSGCKPLVALAKKAPNFNKKEEIFMMLCEYQVPMIRATWFIKLSSAYTVAVSEAKIKKRQLPDPSTEWTGTLLKFLKDQLVKLQDYYYIGDQSSPSTSTTSPSTSTSSANSTNPNHTSNFITSANNIATSTTVTTATSSSSSTPTSSASAALLAMSNSQQPLTPNSSSKRPANLDMTEEQKLAFKQWDYCLQLAKYMYEEGLLDRQEVLQWILELLDKMRTNPADDGILKLLLPLAIQYLDEFVQSELLSRRLAYMCCKKISQVCGKIEALSSDNIIPQSPQDSIASKSVMPNEKSDNGNNKEQAEGQTVEISPLQATFNELLKCPHHRDILYYLSVIIQVIALDCPTALVWNSVGDGKSNSVLNGSPLDLLSCRPSLLPMPPTTSENPSVIPGLKLAENAISLRSKAAENRWSCDKWQSSRAGVTTKKVLAALDALDRHSFDCVDASNSLDTLYSKIFTSPRTTATSSSKDNASASYLSTANNEQDSAQRNEYNPEQDAAMVEILCEWAVSAERWGEHRAMAVAKLLEKRQCEVTGEPSDTDDKESVCSNGNSSQSTPIFQSLLMKFLDKDAPVWESRSLRSKIQFTNLVHLFSELIRFDVFSHDAYMCTLISRGDLVQGPGASKPNTPGSNARDIAAVDEDSLFPSIDLKMGSAVSSATKLETNQGKNTSSAMDYDDSKIDDDLDKLLQDIKEDQQNSMDAPDSPKEGALGGYNDHDGLETKHNIPSSHSSRHFLYTTHFPLPQDDASCQHDCNQRHILLFGVGKIRDEARHIVKKITKEICKLFGKKFSIDVAEGGKVKKHSKSEFNFESITQKFQNLSYFDQHVVTWQCATQVLDMLNTFVAGSSYLPVQEHVAFLFDLMELALNIYGLIDLCIQILKELPDVELQLETRKSTLARNYATNLSLYIVGVLRRYHCCLLLSSEQTTQVFSLLCKVVSQVLNPSDCSSAERCILAHLYDLYTNCSLLKVKPHANEAFINAYPKIRAAYYTPLTPTPSNHLYNSQFMMEILKNPKRGGKIEQQWSRQLNESSSNRYSFVCNAIVAVCGENDNDKLNDIAITCAELSAGCNALNAEWLGVLKALCGSSDSSAFYIDVQNQVDVQDLSIHNSLAIFTSILIARQCFSLEDFVRHIAIPSLVTACDKGRGDSDVEAESGARLACHLLLRLFKTVECPQPSLYSVSTSPHPIPTTNNPRGFNLKLSCDRHLLAAAHDNIKVGPLVAVLKAILVVGDATAGKSSSGSNKKGDVQSIVHSGKSAGPCSVGVNMVSGESELLSHILGTSEKGDEHSAISSHNSLGGIATENVKGLSDFAQQVLQQICSQKWVLERCLQNPEELCQDDMLLDNMLTPRQAQRLLHMICYPDTSPDAFLDQKSHITSIFENLEQWSLRMSWLDLQLMYKQFLPSSSDLSQWLEMVAKASIDIFQKPSSSLSNNKIDRKSDAIWLVAPLVSKLPSAVQGRVLKVSGQVLESGSWSRNAVKERAKSKLSAKLNHQPFLSLVLTCLKGQDDQRENLLTSLHSQLTQFCTGIKEEKNFSLEDFKAVEALQDALQLRFSLIGGLFDTIQRNITVTTDWAILLIQLVSYSVIDLYSNSKLFTTVIDMLATLIHSTLVSDSQTEKDENKKYYQNLMKKLKKELGDRSSQSIKYVRQLLPLPKVAMEVITCEPIGSLTDTKGNKIAGFDSIDKKQGLQVCNSQRVSAWELLEGQKNPAPLSWAWFRAVKMERKPLTYQNAHKLLRYHTHNQIKPLSYYLEPPPLPPEDLEPDKKEDDKADTPMSIDSPGKLGGGLLIGGLMGTLGRGKSMKAKRHRKTKNVIPSTTSIPPQVPQQPNAVQMHQMSSYPNQQPQIPQHTAMFQNQAPQPQQSWYPNQQQQQHPTPQQYAPYNQQIPGAQMGGPRYDRAAPAINQSKQALTNMLRNRHPTNQFMNAQQINQQMVGPASFQNMQRAQFIRQTLRTQHATPNMNQQGMFTPQQQQQNMYSGMQQGINQNYVGYGGQQGMPQQQQLQQNMMNQQQNMFQTQQQMMTSQNQQIMNAQSQQMMGAQRNQEYMQQQRMQANAARPPYLQAPNVTMNAMGPIGSNVQNQPAPPYRQPTGKPGVNVSGVGAANMGMQSAQHMQQMSLSQQRMRQQVMAMQQQQQMQQQAQVSTAGQQATPQLVAHLQRNLGQGPQHPYQHQPPPY